MLAMSLPDRKRNRISVHDRASWSYRTWCVPAAQCWQIFAILLIAAVTTAHAQQFGAGLAGPPGGSTPTTVALSPTLPGSVWISATGAKHGLGYEDSYYSLGGKQRLVDGPLEGRWLAEIHAHIADETGKPFANFGLERIKTFEPTGATLGVNVWFDIDDDQLQFFRHTFYQVGVGGFIKTPYFDFRANGYIPVGTTNFEFGSSAIDCFFQDRIVIETGIDSALRGFDTEFRLRPRHLTMHHGWIDIGGYAYQSDLIDAFGGTRARFGFEPVHGIELSLEINHDSRFDTTGFLRVAFGFGGRDRAHGNYDAAARDLERTVRSDHIVRFQRDLVFAIDPDTGLPYTVHHVDNTAVPGGNGTFELPHDTLADAEATSGPDDIILVREGDGTTTGMNTGITLQEGQLFLGDGVQHDIPLLGGDIFTLCNDIDENKPTITNVLGGNVVTLADRNIVAGFNIDGLNVALHGIFGDGATMADGLINNAYIWDNRIFDLVGDGVHLEDVDDIITIIDNIIFDVGVDAISIDGVATAALVMDAFGTFVVGTDDAVTIMTNDIDNPGGNGISLTGSSGENTYMISDNMIDDTGANGILVDMISDDVVGTGGIWTFANTIIGESFGNGVFLDNFLDAEARMKFSDNIANNSGTDGIHLEDFNGIAFTFTGNTTSDNTEDGLELLRYMGTGGDFDIVTHTSIDNIGDGIVASAGGVMFDADVDITDATVTDNTGNGVIIHNVTNSVVGTDTVISDSTISDNGAGAAAGVNVFLDATPPTPTNTVTISGNTIERNGVNIVSVGTDAGVMLTTNITANPAINDATNDGISLQSFAGAIHFINVSDNSSINGNALIGGGVGMRQLVSDQDTGALTVMAGTVTNNSITNSGGEGADGDDATAFDPNGVFIPPPMGDPNTVGGAGVRIAVDGDANYSVTFDGNTLDNGLDGGNGNLLLATFLVDNGAAGPTDELINTLNLLNNTFEGRNQDGGLDDVIFILSYVETNLDMNVSGNTIRDATDEAFEMDLVDNTLTRLLFENNDIEDTSAVGTTSPISQHGVEITTAGTARLLAEVSGNRVINHGGDSDLNLTSVTDPNSDDPNNFNFGEGVELIARDMSNIAARVINNDVQGTALEGIRVEARNDANFDAVVLGNSLANTDHAMATDPNEVVVQAPGERDFIAETMDAGTMCLALDNNFGLTGLGFFVNGGGGNIDFENGINVLPAAIDGAVTEVPFAGQAASICEAAIVAEEAASFGAFP